MTIFKLNSHLNRLNPSRSRPGFKRTKCVKNLQVQASQAPSPLELFVQWSVANGIEAIGREDSALAMFEAEGGERGLLVVRSLQEGETVIRVPLALTVWDYALTDSTESPTFPGAPWSVRMACKILRLYKSHTREAQAWRPYLDALPSPSVALSHVSLLEHAAQGEYRPGRLEARRQLDLLEHSWRKLDDQAHGGASYEEFVWAMYQVNSRTFGFMVGGSEFRIMVPVADLLNHMGDVAYPLFSSPQVASLDHLSWRLVSPNVSGSTWEMQFRTNKPVQEGQELYISYGKRSNDDFLLQYGFLPLSNPWDDLVLFESLEEALGWALVQVTGGPSPGEVAGREWAMALEAVTRAVRAVEAEVAAEPSAPHPLMQAAEDDAWAQLLRRDGPGAEPGPRPNPGDSDNGGKGHQLFESSPQLKLLPGGKIDRRLTVALTTMWQQLGKDEAAAKRLADIGVAMRAASLLAGFSSSLTDDFASLLRSGAVDQWTSSGPETEYYMRHLRSYRNSIREWDAPWGGDGIDRIAASVVEPSSSSRSDTDPAGQQKGGAAAAAPSPRTQRMIRAYLAHKKMILWDVLLTIKPGPQEIGLLMEARKASR